MFASKYFLFVYTVRDRSAPGAGSLSKTQLIVFAVWDRSAPGAGFCLKLSISVHGPGPFGSGSMFCLERNIIVFEVWDP